MCKCTSPIRTSWVEIAPYKFVSRSILSVASGYLFCPRHSNGNNALYGAISNYDLRLRWRTATNRKKNDWHLFVALYGPELPITYEYFMWQKPTNRYKD